MTALKEPPSPQEFYISYPLYQGFTFAKEQSQAGWDIAFSREPIDTYCPECNAHSIFRQHINGSISHNTEAWVGDGEGVFLSDCPHTEFYTF